MKTNILDYSKIEDKELKDNIYMAWMSMDFNDHITAHNAKKVFVSVEGKACSMHLKRVKGCNGFFVTNFSKRGETI